MVEYLICYLGLKNVVWNYCLFSDRQGIWWRLIWTTNFWQNFFSVISIPTYFNDQGCNFFRLPKIYTRYFLPLRYQHTIVLHCSEENLVLSRKQNFSFLTRNHIFSLLCLMQNVTDAKFVLRHVSILIIVHTQLKRYSPSRSALSSN